MKHYLLKKVSSCILILFLCVPILSMMNQNFNLIPEAYGATTVGSFGFEFKTGFSVNGHDNGKVYRISNGKNVQLKVESISGVSSSKPMTLKFCYYESAQRPSVVMYTNRNLYKTGTYYCGQTVNAGNYYICAEGTGTSTWLSASGKVQCY